MRIKGLFAALTGLCLACTVTGGLSVRAAEENFVTGITAAYGENAVAELESAGYTAVMLPLCGEGEKSVYIGYKTGTENPVTDIVILNDKSETVTLGGIVYNRVSDIAVEGQESGCIFSTDDSKAGNGIVTLSVAGDSGYADDEQYALMNDGSAPVRDGKGQAFDLDPEGNSDRYLFVMRSGLCRPYIGKICAVSGKSMKEAVRNAAAQGCDYYYDNGMKNENGDTVIVGYERTADKTKAVRGIRACKSDKGNSADGTLKIDNITYTLSGTASLPGDTPAYIYTTDDTQTGSPVLMLTSSSRQKRQGDTVRSWVEKTFVKAASPTASVRVSQEELYQEIYKSRDELSFFPAAFEDGTASALGYGCIAEEGTQQPAEEIQSSAPDTSDDFDPEHYLDEVSGEGQTEPRDEGTASVFGTGGTLAAVALAVVALITVFVAGVVVVRYRKAKGVADDEKKE